VDGRTTDDPMWTKALLAAGHPDRADAQGSVPAGSAPDGRADRLRHTPARAELPKVLRAVARGEAAEGRFGRPGPQHTERDFAAWLGLRPLQTSTGGKQRLGAISKMGERTLRRLLIIGASAVVSHACRRGAPEGSWLARMLAREPRMLVTVALANKMARIVWALLAKGGVYRAPVAVA